MLSPISKNNDPKLSYLTDLPIFVKGNKTEEKNYWRCIITKTRTAKNNNVLSKTFTETCSTIANGTIGVFLFLVFTVFPLIYHNSYLDILETKYYCYRLLAGGMLTILLVLGIIMSCIDFIEFKGTHTRYFFGDFLFKPAAKRSCVIADLAVWVFWISAAVSTFLSRYPQEAFWGNKGRYSGLFLLTLYVLCYYIISRLWRPKKWYLDLFLLSGMVLCILGITDYFQMDILGFRKVIAASQATIFTSTLGNINTYTAYVGLLMGFSTTMFALETNAKKIIYYLFCMCVSFTAIIMGCSDNAYLSIAVLFGGLPFVLFVSREGIKRYLIIITAFFSVIQLIDIINHLFSDMVIGLESLFLIIENSSCLIYIVLFLWVFTVSYILYARAHPQSSDCKPEFFKLSLVHWWSGLIAVCLLIVCFLFFDANINGNGQRYGSLQSYLVFNNDWGTSRGYIWKKSLELYNDFSLSRKLFGYGPDTFGLLTDNKIRQEMIAATGLFYDSAHNSFLQYLLTVGFIGTAGYLLFLASSMWYLFKNWGKKNYVLGSLFAVACYVLQSTVNIDLPIVTPVMWLLIAVGVAGCRANDSD